MNREQTKCKSYFCPYGLMKLIATILGLLTVCNIGALGLNGGGLTPVFNPLRNASNANALAAAPFKFTRIGPEKCGLINRYAPPEYSRVAFLKVQSLQTKPSSGWMMFTKVIEEITTPCNGGIIGSAPPTTIPRCWANAGCTQMEVWLPNKNIERAPTINEPNATVTLDIIPPPNNEKSDGVVIHFHYGPPPPHPGEGDKPNGEGKNSTDEKLRI